MSTADALAATAKRSGDNLTMLNRLEMTYCKGPFRTVIELFGNAEDQLLSLEIVTCSSGFQSISKSQTVLTVLANEPLVSKTVEALGISNHFPKQPSSCCTYCSHLALMLLQTLNCHGQKAFGTLGTSMNTLLLSRNVQYVASLRRITSPYLLGCTSGIQCPSKAQFKIWNYGLRSLLSLHILVTRSRESYHGFC